MKKKIIPVVVLFLLSLIYSCERSEDFNHAYLKNHRQLRAYTSNNIVSSLQLLQPVYPEISELADNISYGARVYSISYKTSFLGEEIIASGLVSIPDTRGSFPIISFQNGTNTCHSNAPSVNPNNSLYSLLNVNAGLGYIIIMPDYIGFGESEDFLHLYYHKESSNRIIRDMISAVEEFTDYIEGLSINNEIYLMGYSQGGWATLALVKDIEQYPLDHLNLIAASCGAGAYDLIDFTQYLFSQQTFSNPFYFPYYIESRRQNGIINDPLSLFFKEPYASMIPGLFDGSLCNAEINSNLPNTLDELFTDNILTGFDTNACFLPIKNELIASNITPWKSITPLLFTHSNGDQSVPFQQSLNMYNNLISAGTAQNNLTFVEIDDIDHNDAIIPWGINTFSWFIN